MSAVLHSIIMHRLYVVSIILFRGSQHALTQLTDPLPVIIVTYNILCLPLPLEEFATVLRILSKNRVTSEIASSILLP